ncbi:MAG: transglutaminase-like putative cysteine protease [Pseudohongiellaceae bacterium]|jgi:transglutaminase-like putative cysteine protease
MLTQWQMPRASLLWLLLAQLLVILPLLKYLPVWLLLGYVACVFWRFQIYRGIFNHPGGYLKTTVVLIGFLVVYYSFGTLIGLEATTSLLLVAFSLKLVECQRKRDCLLLCLLCFLLIAVTFLYEQSLLYSLYLFLCLPAITMTMQSLHFSVESKYSFFDIKKSLIIFVQTVPLMIVLFLVFPRFEPFWQITLPNQQASVGVGNVLSPGDITQLTKDSSLAFRATFENTPPNKNEMYWRGVVLSDFDGRSWRQNEDLFQNRQYRPDDKKSSDGVDYRYTIIQEPSHRPLLFSLAVATSSSQGVSTTNDYLLAYKHNIFERISYRVESDINIKRREQLPQWLRGKETKLTGKGNPRARRFANAEYSKLASDEAYVSAILAYFAQQKFYYSLHVPQLGKNSIDEFLFDSRVGYCGHYASSFVFLMRAAGLPSRVVGGYLGGEINPLTSTVLVHQFDAHAWAEVWLAGKGWVRVDPTLQVAPDRVLNSVHDLPSTAAQFNAQMPLSAIRFKHLAWVNYLRLKFDELDYRWANMVLQYKGDTQLVFLQQLLGEVSTPRIFGFFAIVLLPLIAWIMFDYLKRLFNSTLSYEEKKYQKLCALMSRMGVERQPYEGPIDYVRRVERSGYDLKKSAIRHLQSATRFYVALRYDRITVEQQRLMRKQMSNEVNALAKLVLKRQFLSH